MSWCPRAELWPFILVFIGLWKQAGYNTELTFNLLPERYADVPQRSEERTPRGIGTAVAFPMRPLYQSGLTGG